MQLILRLGPALARYRGHERGRCCPRISDGSAARLPPRPHCGRRRTATRRRFVAISRRHRTLRRGWSRCGRSGWDFSGTGCTVRPTASPADVATSRALASQAVAKTTSTPASVSSLLTVHASKSPAAHARPPRIGCVRRALSSGRHSCFVAADVEACDCHAAHFARRRSPHCALRRSASSLRYVTREHCLLVRRHAKDEVARHLDWHYWRFRWSRKHTLVRTRYSAAEMRQEMPTMPGTRQTTIRDISSRGSCVRPRRVPVSSSSRPAALQADRLGLSSGSPPGSVASWILVAPSRHADHSSRVPTLCGQEP